MSCLCLTVVQSIIKGSHEAEFCLSRVKRPHPRLPSPPQNRSVPTKKIVQKLWALFESQRGSRRGAPRQEFQSPAWNSPNSCSRSGKWARDQPEGSCHRPFYISATGGSRSQPILVRTRAICRDRLRNSRNGLRQPPSGRSQTHIYERKHEFGES